MRFFSHHTIAVSAILILAVVLFGNNTPSTLPTKYRINDSLKTVADTATQLFLASGGPAFKVGKVDCFPNYEDSSYVKGMYCIAKIDIGPVIFEKSKYRASSKEHCSSIVGKRVRKALKSNLYSMCQKGEFI